MYNQSQKTMFFPWVFLAISCLLHQCSNGMGTRELEERIRSTKCDLFTGNWVLDDTEDLPLYDASQCPFVYKEFDCQGNGRPDQLYLKYKWQPSACDLPRFDGQDFLERFKGKKIMFVGDSLSANQWQSLKCMLLAASPPKSKYTLHETTSLSTFSIQEGNVTILLNHSPFLVDLVKQNIGRVLKLNSIKINSKAWKGMDMLIFNSYHWWLHKGSLQAWDYIQKGKKVYKDMDRMSAFNVALATWAKWVNTNINSQNQIVFFQSVSPTHYKGEDWGQPGTSCKGQTEPIAGSTYPGGTLQAVKAVEKVLGRMKTSVGLLNITGLSQLRKDGHPSDYVGEGGKGNDCSHWCLAGVPDTWNHLLYALLLSQHPQRL